MCYRFSNLSEVERNYGDETRIREGETSSKSALF
jgi:hypothetical protein